MAFPADAQPTTQLPETTIQPVFGAHGRLRSLASRAGIVLAVALGCIGALAPLAFAVAFAAAPGHFLG